MSLQTKLNRRTVLKGISGLTLALPMLEAMGENATSNPARRFCALYTANGMSLPNPRHGISEWSWFPTTQGRDFTFGKSTESLSPFRNSLSFISGLQHPNGAKADPHICSDMWLTGAPLHDPKPGTFNSVSLDQIVALHTRKECRQPSLVLSIDAGVGFLSRTGTISYNLEGKPIPAENNPRRVFDRLFRVGEKQSAEVQRDGLENRMKLVDAVRDNTRALQKKLGRTDNDKLDQYLTSLTEIESRLTASEKWINVPIKSQDRSHLNLEITSEGEPGEYYRNMFDLIALAFDADITRSVTFMLSREDGMGVSDTFPIKLGLGSTHHNLSHAEDKDGQLQFAKYDQFLNQQLAHFLEKLSDYKEADSNIFENTIILYGSGASTTHNPSNLPTLIAGGTNMGLQHGTNTQMVDVPMSNLYLSILRSMGIEVPAFADSTGVMRDAVFGSV